MLIKALTFPNDGFQRTSEARLSENDYVRPAQDLFKSNERCSSDLHTSCCNLLGLVSSAADM